MLRKKSPTPVNTQAAIAELFMKLADAGCDPISELAELAMNPATPLDTKVSILKDLAGYTAPKRRAIDVTTKDEGVVKIAIRKFTQDAVGEARRMMNPEVLKSELEASRLQQATQNYDEEEVANG